MNQKIFIKQHKASYFQNYGLLILILIGIFLALFLGQTAKETQDTLSPEHFLQEGLRCSPLDPCNGEMETYDCIDIRTNQRTIKEYGCS